MSIFLGFLRFGLPLNSLINPYIFEYSLFFLARSPREAGAVQTEDCTGIGPASVMVVQEVCEVFEGGVF